MRKFYWNTVGKKFSTGNVCLSTEQADYSYQCMWTISSKTENIEPTWKILMKDVDLGEPTSFFDPVYLGCSQRECKISNDIVAGYRDMFVPELQGNLTQKQYLLAITWKVMQRNAWKDLANLQKNDSTIVQSRNVVHG